MLLRCRRSDRSPRHALAPLLLAFLALGPALVASAEETGDADEWELEDSDRDAGWELFTSRVPGSDHARYRLVARSDEPVERIAAALRLKLHDLRYMPEDYDRTILRNGDGFMVNYVRMDVPVVSDRDVVLDTRWWTDEAGRYHVRWSPPEGELPPVPDGVTRIQSRGSWEISPLPGGGSRLVYTQHSELGDSIPGWLVSSLMNGQIVNEYLTLARILQTQELPAVAAPPGSTAAPEAAGH